MGGLWLPAKTPGPIGGVAHSRPPYFKTKKVGILGRTTNIRYAPWHDPSWTLISHTSAREFCRREPDWYFDLHRPECFRTEHKSWNPQFYTWLKRLQTPIFMQEAWPEIPMAVRYPIERILQEFRAYFTNHVSYMIALAMTEDVKTIGLFGCQYGAHTEYSTQRGSVEYWLGRFEQAGGDVILPVKDNTLLGFPKGLYGYESHDDKGRLTGDYLHGMLLKTRLAKANPKGQAADTVELELLAGTSRPCGLMPPPHGEPIAWDRRAALFGGGGDAVARSSAGTPSVAGVSRGALEHAAPAQAGPVGDVPHAPAVSRAPSGRRRRRQVCDRA